MIAERRVDQSKQNDRILDNVYDDAIFGGDSRTPGGQTASSTPGGFTHIFWPIKPNWRAGLGERPGEIPNLHSRGRKPDIN
jgi:hypothetical protein